MFPGWNSSTFGMEIQSNELNCGFLNPNWENSMDQSDPFESALSSIVSSPVASNAGGDGIVLRELIGRLGSICNSGEISPEPYIAGNNSTNNSCYSTPLNSPPKLNLSVMDHQMKGNFPIPGNNLPNHPNLTPFSSDPGFAERAARFSCFGSMNHGGLNGQFRLNEAELPPRMEPGMVSRVSGNHSVKFPGSQMGGNSGSDKKFSRLSRSSTPDNAEFGDSREESSISEQIPGGEIGIKVQSDANGRKRKAVPKGKAKENPSPKAAAESDESNAKRSKSDEANGNEKDAAKAKSEANDNGNQKQSKESAKPPEPPKDYIHVRARRGQATDSHSLAERVRREKISERMKFLQDLVPGCNKVTGKAVMLDEIINYVQSLQRQVEFLSMKLATVNPRTGFDMEALLSKDIFQSRGSEPHNMYPSDSTSPSLPFGYLSPQGPSLHSGISNGTEAAFSVHSLNAGMQRNPTMQVPAIGGFSEAASQHSTFWGDDLQSVVQMGFGQNQPQNFHGTVATGQMKVEL